MWSPGAMATAAPSGSSWYYPYGSNDKDHGATPSGRFSNGLVLPDFVGA